MNDFFKMQDEQKKLVIEQTANKTGLPTRAIEKDLWVTVILQSVFTLPYADKFVFKGGTSLSKVWNLIQRFSEDIDLAIDRNIFDCKGDLTTKQIKKLRKESSLFVKGKLCNDLHNVVTEHNLDNFCKIEAEPNGEGDATYPEPRKIHIYYKSLFEEKTSYLLPEVILEIGARSLIEPTKKAKVRSLISSNIDEISTDIVNPDIITAVPEKTFLEKSFLLHELFSVGSTAVADRKSRHLYDLERMMDYDFARSAINDDSLWESIRHHREIFTHVKGVNYAGDIRKRICLVPPSNVFDNWQKDYLNMQTSMIYENNPLTFNKLVERIRELEELFHNRIR